MAGSDWQLIYTTVKSSALSQIVCTKSQPHSSAAAEHVGVCHCVQHRRRRRCSVGSMERAQLRTPRSFVQHCTEVPSPHHNHHLHHHYHPLITRMMPWQRAGISHTHTAHRRRTLCNHISVRQNGSISLLTSHTFHQFDATSTPHECDCKMRLGRAQPPLTSLC